VFCSTKQLRVAHQRAANCEHLLLAARQSAARLRQPLAQARKKLNHALEPLGQALFLALQKRTEFQVLAHAQPAEDGASFRHQRRAERHAPMRRHAVHLTAEQAHAAAGHRHEADQRLQHAGLARAVRADQRHNLPAS
jgi:hypothetical protein